MNSERDMLGEMYDNDYEYWLEQLEEQEINSYDD